MDKDILIIGVDGGATKVNACEVSYSSDTDSFNLGLLNSEKSYQDIPGFVPDFAPVPVADQLQDRDGKNMSTSDEEVQQEAVYVEACALVIEDIAKQSSLKDIIVGIGMPGLKTADKRGIAVVANGPRMLNYANLLEERLVLTGIQLAAPVFHLGSDADYCGIGENYSANGLFKNADNAYYLGGGTGVADALKLGGKLLPFDQTKDWIAKSWELKSENGKSLERFASAGGIRNIYSEISGQKMDTLDALGIYPLQISEQAEQGDMASEKTFALVTDQISLLLYERIITIYSGWKSTFKFMNEKRPSLKPDHSFSGTLLDQIIIGQRLAEIMQTDHGKTTLYRPLIEKLNDHIQESDHLDDRAKKHYEQLNQIIFISQLREAPALGAGIDAWQNYRKGL